MSDNTEGKQPSQKPAASNENRKENKQGQERGEAVRAAGNKVHGDKLEGMIVGTPNRPERDDGDNDDEGELK